MRLLLASIRVDGTRCVRLGAGLALLIMGLLSGGCARVVVKPHPGPRDSGLRFYRPKPYLWISPAVLDGQTAVEPMRPVTIRMEYLPDFSEEYSIRMTPGINSNTQFSPELQNGWNLVGFKSQADQGTADLVSAVADALPAIQRGSGAVLGDGAIMADVDLPLGYYESVIVPDSCGRKRLVGWRYVGFVPFQGCPMDGFVGTYPASCDPTALWSLVYEGNVLRFKRQDIVTDAAGQRAARDLQLLPPIPPERLIPPGA